MPAPGTPFLMAAPSQQIQEVRRLLIDAGFRPTEPFEDRFAFTRHCFREATTGIELRVAFDLLETDVAPIPVSDRLNHGGITLLPSELLLTRLGWSQKMDRHSKEAEALLRKFEVAGHDDGNVINGFYFAAKARSSPSLEAVVKTNLHGLEAISIAPDIVADRIQLLEVWLSSVKKGWKAPVGSRPDGEAQVQPTRPLSRGATHGRSLYRNWIYPTMWM